MYHVQVLCIDVVLFALHFMLEHLSDAQVTNVMPQGLIGNFQEVNDDTQTGVAFSFDLLLANFRDINNRDKFQLQWQTTNGSKVAISLSVRRDRTIESAKLGGTASLLLQHSFQKAH